MVNLKEAQNFAWVHEKYSLAGKKEFGKLIVKYKKDYYKEFKNEENTYRWNQNLATAVR